MIVSIIGYAGLALNLFSMSLKGEYRMRIFSLLANCIYIIYGTLIIAYPIIIGSSIAVVLHSLRLTKIKTQNDRN
jgi:cytochrome bd-type quinol oxidase subunit 2